MLLVWIRANRIVKRYAYGIFLVLFIIDNINWSNLILTWQAYYFLNRHDKDSKKSSKTDVYSHDLYNEVKSIPNNSTPFVGLLGGHEPRVNADTRWKFYNLSWIKHQKNIQVRIFWYCIFSFGNALEKTDLTLNFNLFMTIRKFYILQTIVQSMKSMISSWNHGISK